MALVSGLRIEGGKPRCEPDALRGLGLTLSSDERTRLLAVTRSRSLRRGTEGEGSG